MAFLINGHDDENDDLYGPAPTPNDHSAENGWTGGSGTVRPADESSDYDPRNWGGRGYDDRNGWAQMGTSVADEDVESYRQRGTQHQAAPQLASGPESQARRVQMGALARLQAAARGNAPSRAAALGQLSSDNALIEGNAGVAGARGPGASIAAMRGAQAATAAKMAQANQQTMDMRAGETARDQAAYASGASGVRGQDLQGATTNAQLEAQQRALEEQRQQAYEKMAWDTRNAQMNAAMERQRQDEGQDLAHRQQREAEKEADIGKAKDAASMSIGAVMAMMSDERTKTNVAPIGGLARLFRSRR